MFCFRHSVCCTQASRPPAMLQHPVPDMRWHDDMTHWRHLRSHGSPMSPMNCEGNSAEHVFFLELRYPESIWYLEEWCTEKDMTRIQDMYKNKGQQEITTPVLRLELSKFVVHRQTLLSGFNICKKRMEYSFDRVDGIDTWVEQFLPPFLFWTKLGWLEMSTSLVSLSYRRARSLSQLSWVFDIRRCELVHAYQKYCPSMGQIRCRISPNKKKRTRHVCKVRLVVSRQVLIGL